MKTKDMKTDGTVYAVEAHWRLGLDEPHKLIEEGTGRVRVKILETAGYRQPTVSYPHYDKTDQPIKTPGGKMLLAQIVTAAGTPVKLVALRPQQVEGPWDEIVTQVKAAKALEAERRRQQEATIEAGKDRCAELNALAIKLGVNCRFGVHSSFNLARAGELEAFISADEMEAVLRRLS